MITIWMLQCAAVSALLALAALAAERMLRLWGREARTVWALAMAASLVLPLISVAQAAGWIPRFGTPPAIQELRAVPFAVLMSPVRVGAELSPVDVGLVGCWLLASLGLTMRFATAARALGRQRGAWRSATIDGHRLFVSHDAGPAVVGFRAPAVVVPEWVLGLEKPLRALVLRHTNAKVGDRTVRQLVQEPFMFPMSR